MYKKIFSTLLMGFFLNGCDNSESDSEFEDDKSSTISGFVVNSINAKVFLDYNHNLKHDENEPSTFSDIHGFYTLNIDNISFECYNYSPIVAKFTSDSNYISNGLNNGSYTLVRSPDYSNETKRTESNINAFTTMIWNNSVSDFNELGKFYDCQNQISNINEIYSFSDSKIKISKEYNIDQQTLLSNYQVNYNNTDRITNLAEIIINGLINVENASQEFKSRNNDKASIYFNLKQKDDIVNIDPDNINTFYWNSIENKIDNSNLYINVRNHDPLDLQSYYHIDDILLKNSTYSKSKKFIDSIDTNDNNITYHYYESEEKDFKENSCMITEELYEENHLTKNIKYTINGIKGNSCSNSTDFLTDSNFRLESTIIGNEANIKKEGIVSDLKLISYKQIVNDTGGHNYADYRFNFKGTNGTDDYKSQVLFDDTMHEYMGYQTNNEKNIYKSIFNFEYLISDNVNSNFSLLNIEELISYYTYKLNSNGVVVKS